MKKSKALKAERLIVDCPIEQREALIAFMDALKISYKRYPYSKAFEEKMQRADEDLAAGRFTTMKVEDLKNLWK